MTVSERRILKPADIFIISITVIIGVLLLFVFKSGGDPVAVITVDGETVRRINLTYAQDEIITLNTSPQVTLQVKNSEIRFINATCPDKTCENSGFLGKIGDTAACVPAKTVVTVTGDRRFDDVDAIAS